MHTSSRDFSEKYNDDDNDDGDDDGEFYILKLLASRHIPD